MKSNSTGKPVEFYELGKKMFDRIKPLTPNKPAIEKRVWVGLTLEDMQDLNVSKDWLDGARWAATLLLEKNT